MALDYVEARIVTDDQSISAINLNNGKEEWLAGDNEEVFMVASPELMDSAMYNYVLLDHRTNTVYAIQSVDLDFDLP